MRQPAQATYQYLLLSGRITKLAKLGTYWMKLINGENVAKNLRAHSLTVITKFSKSVCVYPKPPRKFNIISADHEDRKQNMPLTYSQSSHSSPTLTALGFYTITIELLTNYFGPPLTTPPPVETTSNRKNSHRSTSWQFHSKQTLPQLTPLQHTAAFTHSADYVRHTTSILIAGNTRYNFSFENAIT